MIVHVATVSTRDAIMAVGTTEASAIALACQKALEYLTERDAVYPDTDTPEKIADYFGVSATAIEVGTARLVQY